MSEPGVTELALGQPTLLLAMPQLDDPNFRRAVILLCQHSEEGAWGVVVNRPTGQKAARAVQMDPPIVGDSDLEIWVGGPVDPGRGCILLGSDPGGNEAVRIADGLYLSGSALLLRRLLEEEAPPRTRVFMGYAGWGPGQLEQEMQQSAWLFSDADPDLIFGTSPAEMWEAAIRRLGADPASLQLSSGVH